MKLDWLLSNAMLDLSLATLLKTSAIMRLKSQDSGIMFSKADIYQKNCKMGQFMVIIPI
jgi:hypothetical protein